MNILGDAEGFVGLFPGHRFTHVSTRYDFGAVTRFLYD